MLASLCRGQPLWECPTLNISICLAGFAGVTSGWVKGGFGANGGASGLRYQCLCRVCAGMLGSMRSMRSMRGGIIFRNRGPSLGERGLGLVDHVPLGCVAKINIP
jgi:hypothetical protein